MDRSSSAFERSRRPVQEADHGRLLAGDSPPTVWDGMDSGGADGVFRLEAVRIAAPGARSPTARPRSPRHAAPPAERDLHRSGACHVYPRRPAPGRPPRGPTGSPTPTTRSPRRFRSPRSLPWSRPGHGSRPWSRRARDHHRWNHPARQRRPCSHRTRPTHQPCRPARRHRCGPLPTLASSPEADRSDCSAFVAILFERGERGLALGPLVEESLERLDRAEALTDEPLGSREV